MLSARRLSLRSRRLGVVLCAAAAVLVAARPAYAQQAQPLVAGQNVNMVGGPWSYDPASGRIVGDPFLQRQNEPSLALSSRNPCHILAGANDYRAVDVPGLPGDTETGDAWLGLLKSIDCGQTWTSTLLPGYPQDRSAEGMASPLKGLAAGADATVRAGVGGLFYYSGIAFNRGSNDLGKVFVSTFLDDNNKEQGDPMRYVSTVIVDTGTSGQFLDKPWIAADIPRSGATCSVNGQAIPAGPVYMAYTSFVGGTNNPRSKIMFSRSSDCGATWSNPAKLSERIALNQGTVMAVSPVDGSIFIAWREFADRSLDPNSPSTVSAILFARSTDGGKSFTKAAPIDSALHPFDQGSSTVSFRTNAYPAMAVDGSGRLYVAWAARGFSAAAPDPVAGDARIVMSTSSDGGASWSMPRSVVDNYPGAGHQFMPTLTFAAGKLVIAYYDLRDDVSQVFGKYVNEAEAGAYSGKRHTLELRAAMADPASAPQFTSYTTVTGGGAEVPSTPVSQYLFGNYDSVLRGRRVNVQLQYNPPNLPIFAQGTVPFIGDYIDIASQAFVLDASRTWQFNTAADATGRRVPLFHVAWTDNRDVRRPPAGQTWASYKSPTLGPTGQTCDPGTNPGSRNQNVYTAPLMPGLVVTAPGNQKSLGQIQRAFVVYVRNTTYTDRWYSLTIAQPPAGAFASFQKIDEANPANALALARPIFIPKRSSIARSVFIVSPGIAYPVVTVNVAEVTTGGAIGAQASVALNPDIANPDIANPDIANPDIANPDIANAEVYNPDIANVMVNNPDIANPDIANPDIANPDIANPDIANRGLTNPDIANPDIANPDIANPDIANPDIANPDIANPDIANPDIANTSVTDITWTVKNKGNTTAAYAFRAKLTQALPNATTRLIVRRVYIAPQADLNNACGDPVPAVQNQMLVNIPNPNLSANLSASFDPAAYDDNASFYLQPSDEGRVTLRVWCPKGDATCQAAVAQARSLVAARIEAQAPNNCPAGSTFAACQVNGFRPDDIYDTVPPVTSCSITADGATRDCSQGPFYVKGSALVTLTPTDGVGVLSTSYSLDGTTSTGTAFTVSGEGQHEFSFGSTDPSHNAEAPRTVNVQIDNAPPVVTGFTFPPASIDGQWLSAPSVTGAITTSDSSPITVTCGDTLNGTTTSGLTITVSGDGAHVLTCTISDGAGNTTTAGATVNLDATSPTVTPASAVVTAEASGASGAAVSYSVAATDLLSGAAVSCTPPSGSTFVLGDTLVTCTATDGAGNTSAATFTVTVADTIAPVVSVAGTLSAEATSASGAVVTFSASAVDAVDGALAASCVPASGSVFPIGSTTVNCVATDRSGNTGQTSATVTVGDTTPPAVTVPAPITAEATSASGAAVTFAAAATDIVSGSLAATCAPASGTTFAIGATSVTCTAADAASNIGSASFTVTVADATKPAVTVPGPITAEATGPAGAAVTFAASATDIVSGSLAAACLPAAGSIFGLGTTPVLCSATDSSGNTGSATFTVMVRDTTPPVLALPAPMTVSATSLSGAAVSFTASATDLVSGAVTPVCAPTSGTAFPIGTTTVTCAATDGAGNTATGTFPVTVQLQYGFINVKNLPPPSGSRINLGSSVPLAWRWTVGGVAVNTADAQPLVTIVGPTGTATFTPETPGNSTFQYTASSSTWQFNWQTKGLVVGTYTVTVTSRKTNQTSSGGQITLR